MKLFHEQEYPGLASYALSRLAVCLIELACQCECVAIQKRDPQILDNAVRASVQAIALNRRYRHLSQRDTTEPVGDYAEMGPNDTLLNFSKLSYFNAACASAVKARLIVHRAILSQTDKSLLKPLAEAPTANFSETLVEQWEAGKENLASNWRTTVQDKRIIKEVNETAEEAMNALRRLTDLPRGYENALLDAEIDHWVNLTESDADCGFLRGDLQYSASYDAWLSTWKRNRRAECSHESMLALALNTLPLHLRT